MKLRDCAAILVTITLILSACAKNTTKTIHLAVAGDPALVEFYRKEVAPALTRAHPDLTLKVTGGPLKRGDAPDIAVVEASAIPGLVEQGLITQEPSWVVFRPHFALAYNARLMNKPPQTIKDLMVWVKENPNRFGMVGATEGQAGHSFALAWAHAAGPENLWELGALPLVSPESDQAVLDLLGSGEIVLGAVSEEAFQTWTAQSQMKDHVRWKTIAADMPITSMQYVLPPAAKESEATKRFLELALSLHVQSGLLNVKGTWYPGMPQGFNISPYKEAVAKVFGAGLVISMSQRKPEEVPGRLYLLDRENLLVVQGGKEKLLGSLQGFDDPRLSPNAQFLTARKESNLALFSLDETGLKLLSSVPHGEHPTWTPDSERLAIATGETITILDRSGKTQKVIAGLQDVHTMAWAPNGTQLLVNAGIPPAHDTVAALWLIDTTTGHGKQVAENVFYYSIGWSPDGRAFTYQSLVGSTDDELVLVPVDGKPRWVLNERTLVEALPSLTKLFDENALSLASTAWSPEGDRLVATYKAAGGDPRFGVVLLKPDATVLANWILPLHKESNPPNEWPPRPCNPSINWLQQGQKLAVLMAGPGCDGQLVILDAKTLRPEIQVATATQGELGSSPDKNWVGVLRSDSHMDFFTLSPRLGQTRVRMTGRLLGWK